LAATAFRPGDILVGIHDVARLQWTQFCALITISVRRFHPFIDAGWAVPRRGAGNTCSDFAAKIGNAQVDRLIFFVIGIGQEYR
jgi:hypothetical protein